MKFVCPILFDNKQEEYNLTDKDIENFCNKGCSVDCDIFLEEFAKKRQKRCDNE